MHRARPGVSVCDRKRRSLPFALRAPLVRLRIRRLDVAVSPFERGRWRDTRASCQRTLPNAGRCAAACVVHLVAETGSSRLVGRQPGRVCRACRLACAAVCRRALSFDVLVEHSGTAYTQLASRGCGGTPESRLHAALKMFSGIPCAATKSSCPFAYALALACIGHRGVAHRDVQAAPSARLTSGVVQDGKLKHPRFAVEKRGQYHIRITVAFC